MPTCQRLALDQGHHDLVGRVLQREGAHHSGALQPGRQAGSSDAVMEAGRRFGS